MEPGSHYFNVEEMDAGSRLDVYLSGEDSDLSRSYVQRLLSEGMVSVNGKPARASYRVKPGDEIVLLAPVPAAPQAEAEQIPLDVFYEDSDVVVVNKPRGMVVHPAEGNHRGTLVNALLYHCKDLSGINGVLRPGIVHRLDKDTSGLLMAAKNDEAHLELARQLQKRQVERRYLALAHGNVRDDRGRVDGPIGRDPGDRQKMAVVFRNSKPAVTHYAVLERLGEFTYMELKLQTGRTHQIRVHMSYIGHPLVGDSRYGRARNRFHLEGQFLHAAVLGFNHPSTGGKMFFKAPLPAELAEILDELRRENKS